MNRSDLRLVVTILATAIVSAVVTVLVYAQLTARPRASEDARLDAVETRVRALEAALAEPPDDPAAEAEAEDEEEDDDATPAPDACDEVSCVLNNYKPECCAQYTQPIAAPPDGIDRAIVSAGIASVRPRVDACGEKIDASGVVKVDVTVAPDGRVANVTVKEAPDVALGKCVAAAVQTAKFAATHVGGKFAYPFVF